MTTDIQNAFAHPEARAIASAEGPRDRISLRDHIVEVEIGAFQAERDTTQRVSFNIVVEVVPITGPVEDDVDRILSYDTVTEAIALELGAERLNLLETLAERLAKRILAEPQAHRVFIRIEKLDRGPGALGVEIVRSRGEDAAHLAETRTGVPHPTVVFLSNAALADDRLSAAIDRWQQTDPPLILCVDLPGSPLPQTSSSAARRRIALLSLEQNAWVLAGRDSRCAVVETRTELDWAMKNGKISVWAPSKLVLDAVQRPQSDAPVDLALWLAEQVGAAQVLVVGTTLPKSAKITVHCADLVL